MTAILLAAAGVAHIDRGDGTTVCGRSVLNPVSVTDNQIRTYELGQCPQCFPHSGKKRG